MVTVTPAAVTGAAAAAAALDSGSGFRWAESQSSATSLTVTGRPGLTVALSAVGLGLRCPTRNRVRDHVTGRPRLGPEVALPHRRGRLRVGSPEQH